FPYPTLFRSKLRPSHWARKSRMKRSTEKEMMDLPGNPKALLVEDLRNLRIINRYLGGYRGVIKGLKRLVGEGRMRRFSLLDVGTGSADIPKGIVQWARNRGIGGTGGAPRR